MPEMRDIFLRFRMESGNTFLQQLVCFFSPPGWHPEFTTGDGCFLPCIPLGLSITILLDEIGGFGSISATPLLASIAIPFIAAFLLERKRNQCALIPAWVMLVVSMITLLADRVSGNLMGTFVLWSIAFPFLAVFLYNRSNRWALIPAGILGIIGTLPLLSSLLSGDAVGVAVMLLFGVAFLVVYLYSRNNWWALIPSGVFFSIALVVLLSSLKIGVTGDHNGTLTAVLLAGFGLTFGVIWLLRGSQPTEWAKYPSLGLFAAAVLAAITGRIFQIFWPIILIVIGLAIIISFVFWKPAKKSDEANISDIE